MVRASTKVPLKIKKWNEVDVFMTSNSRRHNLGFISTFLQALLSVFLHRSLKTRFGSVFYESVFIWIFVWIATLSPVLLVRLSICRVNGSQTTCHWSGLRIRPNHLKLQIEMIKNSLKRSCFLIKFSAWDKSCDS